jgi:anti-sigma-K factor RskA
VSTPQGPTHEQWEELAAGYALHALEPDEEQALLAHLATCADCRQAVDEHAFVASQLGALAEDSDITPPSWSAIRSGVIATPPAPAVSLDEARRRRRAARVLGAAAAVVGLAAVGVTAWQLSSDDKGAAGTVASCDAAPSCHVVRLQADSAEKAVILAENGTATVLPTDLPRPGAGHVYALWQLPRDGRPVLVTEISDSGKGVSSAAPLVLPYDDTAAFAMSVEPTGAVPTKPTEVVATGTATA